MAKKKTKQPPKQVQQASDDVMFNLLDSKIEIPLGQLRQKHIFIAPGTIFGSNGAGFVRFSLCADENAIKEAIKRTA